MSKKKKPVKNSGDTLMTVGVLMVVASILLPIIGVSMSESANLWLLVGGIVIGVLGWGVRNARRRKAGV